MSEIFGGNIARRFFARNNRRPVHEQTSFPQLPEMTFVPMGESLYGVKVRRWHGGSERGQAELERVALGKWVTDMGRRIGESVVPASIEALRERFPFHMQLLENAPTDAVAENADPDREGSRDWAELSWARKMQMKVARGNFLLMLDHGGATYARQLSVLEDLEPIQTIFQTPAEQGRPFHLTFERGGLFVQFSHPMFSSFRTEGCGVDIPEELWRESEEDTRVAF